MRIIRIFHISQMSDDSSLPFKYSHRELRNMRNNPLCERPSILMECRGVYWSNFSCMAQIADSAGLPEKYAGDRLRHAQEETRQEEVRQEEVR